MKDALGHGSNKRGVVVSPMAAHQAGIGAIPTLQNVVAYHATTANFEGLPQVHSDGDWNLLDRMLGPHYAADPDVSNSFVMKDVNGNIVGAKDGGRIYAVTLPSEDKFLEVNQPRYDWAKNNPNIKDWQARASDQSQIEKMIATTGYKKDPAMLSRYLTEARNIPREQAEPMARDLAAGKTVHFPTEGREYNLDRFTENFGGRPFNKSDRERLVSLARQEWQAQGYKGLKYVDTSPMEMAHANNPRAYVLFDPKDAKSKWRKLP